MSQHYNGIQYDTQFQVWRRLGGDKSKTISRRKKMSAGPDLYRDQKVSQSNKYIKYFIHTRPALHSGKIGGSNGHNSVSDLIMPVVWAEGQGL